MFIEKVPKASGYRAAAAALVTPAGALVSAVIALIGLARRWQDIGAMEGGGTFMVPATAIGLLLGACTLLFLRSPRRAAVKSISRVAAAATMVLGLVVVGQYTAEAGAVRGTLFAGGGWWAQRPSPMTALGLVFIGASLLALGAQRVRRWVGFGGAATLVVALTGLVGHAYGASPLYGLSLWGGCPCRLRSRLAPWAWE